MSNVASFGRKIALTSWEAIWYVVQNIFFGSGYFAKIPAKKAMHDFGLVELTGAEQFWYVVQCIFFGAGYFAKIPTAKALSELPQYRAGRQAALGNLTSPAAGSTPVTLELSSGEAGIDVPRTPAGEAAIEPPTEAEG